MSKKKIIIATSIVAVIFIISGAYFYFTNAEDKTASNGGDIREVNSVDYGEATTPQKSAGDAAKEESIRPQDVENIPQNATLTISRASQTGTVVSVRTVLENISDGTCTFTLSMPGQASLVKSVAVVASPTYYTCTPLNISSDEFSVEGSWKLSAVASNGSTKSNVATAQVSVSK